VNSQEERETRCPALPATEQELRIVPNTHGEVQRGADTTAEIHVDFSPIRVRPKALIEFLEQRHDRVKLLCQHLIGNLPCGMVDLPSRLNRLLGTSQFRGFGLKL
jgi:hypothetical protein